MTALERLVERVEAWTGADLARGGRADALARFVAARMAALGVATMDAYVDGLATPSHPEVARLVDAITVSHTWFYRDAEQMEVVAGILRDLARISAGPERARPSKGPAGRRLRIWVPGCATGEDAYTAAMLAVEAGIPAHVLGTDINSEVLPQAMTGRYVPWSLRELPVALRAHVVADGTGRFAVAAPVRAAVAFERHNLLDPPPEANDGPGWDLILCRNVLIYFSRRRAADAVERLGNALVPGGWLVLGASEVLHTVPAGLRISRLADRFALRRPASGERPPPRPFAEALAAAGSPAEAPRPGRPAAISHTAAAHPARVQNSVAVVVSLANQRLEAGELTDAVALYAKALELDPLSAEARLFTGIAHHMAGDPAAAALALKGALLLDPDLWPAAFYLALSYDKLGLAGEAQREYRRVVEAEGGSLRLQSRSVLLGDLAAFRRDVAAVARTRAERTGGP